MDLKTKRIIINKLSKEYKKANKKQKGEILTELIRLNGYNRSYARRVLRKPVSKVKQIRFKKSKYIDILPQLKKL